MAAYDRANLDAMARGLDMLDFAAIELGFTVCRFLDAVRATARERGELDDGYEVLSERLPDDQICLLEGARIAWRAGETRRDRSQSARARKSELERVLEIPPGLLP
jgi:ribosomal protein L40E